MKKKDRKLLLELKTLVSQEKSNNELVSLERGFYKKIRDEMSELRVRAHELSETGKFDEALKLLSYAEQIEESLDFLIQLRLRKILTFVTWKNRDTKNMTPEEIQLFTDIKQAIELFENQVYGKEEVPEPPPAEYQNIIEEQDNAIPEDGMEEKVETPLAENEPYVLVRVKAHVGRFVLPGDVVYNLRKEDVLYLPEKVYRILSRTDKVEELRITR